MSLDRQLVAGSTIGVKIHTSHFEDQTGDAALPAHAKFTEICLRSCLSSQPFQSGVSTPQPIRFQVETHHGSCRMASALCSISSGVWRLTENGSNSSDNILRRGGLTGGRAVALEMQHSAALFQSLFQTASCLTECRLYISGKRGRPPHFGQYFGTTRRKNEESICVPPGTAFAMPSASRFLA